MDCSPVALAELAKCFCGIPPGDKDAIMLYLLAVIRGGAVDPGVLAREAKDFIGVLNEDAIEAMKTYLLCQIVNGGGGPSSCAEQSGAGSPIGAKTPDFVGQLYHDTVADTYYRSTGLTSADWTLISGGATGDLIWGPAPKGTVAKIGGGADQFYTNLNFDWFGGPTLFTEFSFLSVLEVTGDVTLGNCAIVRVIEFPNLVTIGGSLNANNSTGFVTVNLGSLETVQGFSMSGCIFLVTLDLGSLTAVGPLGVNLGGCDSLSALDISSLATVGSDFELSSNVLTSLDLGALVSVAGGFYVSDSPALTSLSVPNFVPLDGTDIDCSVNALNATSIELILRRCVLAGVTTCVIDVSGGTNAGVASLNAQGQADVATLGAQLTINP